MGPEKQLDEENEGKKSRDTVPLKLWKISQAQLWEKYILQMNSSVLLTQQSTHGVCYIYVQQLVARGPQKICSVNDIIGRMIFFGPYFSIPLREISNKWVFSLGNCSWGEGTE